ncbi:MAG: hypothetical protein JXR22_12270 [Prolixibacteraceae bacterium]|nr:hypothetical protein [Prolixibacteraceae bacterium]
MNTLNNMYYNQIIEILSPFLGNIMAQGAVMAQCKKIGISPEKITKGDISKLAEGMKKALVVFVGTDGALSITERITRI